MYGTCKTRMLPFIVDDIRKSHDPCVTKIQRPPDAMLPIINCLPENWPDPSLRNPLQPHMKSAFLLHRICVKERKVGAKDSIGHQHIISPHFIVIVLHFVILWFRVPVWVVLFAVMSILLIAITVAILSVVL